MPHFQDTSVYPPQRPRSQEGRFRCVALLYMCDIIIITITIIAKGAWKVRTSAPVYLRHVRLPGAPLTTHAREQQEAHLRAPALLRLDPPCPRRARFDQNNRAWRTWSLLRGKEAVQNVVRTRTKNDLTSTEMRACPFSGLPGGYPEAPRAGAGLKNAYFLQSSAPCETIWSRQWF